MTLQSLIATCIKQRAGKIFCGKHLVHVQINRKLFRQLDMAVSVWKMSLVCQKSYFDQITRPTCTLFGKYRIIFFVVFTEPGGGMLQRVEPPHLSTVPRPQAGL